MEPLAAVILRASCQNSRPFFITIVDYTISTTSGVEPNWETVRFAIAINLLQLPTSLFIPSRIALVADVNFHGDSFDGLNPARYIHQDSGMFKTTTNKFAESMSNSIFLILCHGYNFTERDTDFQVLPTQQTVKGHFSQRFRNVS